MSTEGLRERLALYLAGEIAMPGTPEERIREIATTTPVPEEVNDILKLVADAVREEFKGRVPPEDYRDVAAFIEGGGS